ncbi:MAG: DUF4054 domain-containing protein [Clostridiales bacterium]|jgi:hypothetical protein|nr:DUF4054 domain-containing protein [Clostridiales bacterium]
MDTASVLSIFRLIAPEFSEADDSTVETWINLSAPLVSKKRFGKLYFQALALLAAHRMKMNTGGESSSAGTDSQAIAAARSLHVASFSEGETSISFDTNLAAYTADNAEYAMTQYGLQYLNLRRLRIIPIVSAGECYGGS